MKILEELDDTLEKDTKAMAYDMRLTTRIRGKEDLEDWVGEYTPDKVRTILHRTWPTLVPQAQAPEINELSYNFV